MLLPALAYYIIFHYIPMYGVTVAFKDFNFNKGILGSSWAGLKHFEYLFRLDKFFSVFGNTLYISFLRLIFGFPVPIIVSLFINEIRSVRYKRVFQTAIYLPHFISWVVIGGILVNLLSIDNGLINTIIKSLGFSPVSFLGDAEYFVPTMIVSMIWKEYGWGTIIYLAALTGIDPQLYESARVDGAGRFRQMIHISLPGISTAIFVVLILRIGGMMQAGFEQIFVLYHPRVYKVADIIDTFVYRLGLAEGKFSLAAAVGLFKSIVGLFKLTSANLLARRFDQEGVF